jgi:activator of HSP90 ATPase
VNKDASAWARKWFEDNLTKIEAKEGDVTAKISSVISMTGDVDVAQRKGKVITIFDVKLTLEYTGTYCHRIQLHLLFSQPKLHLLQPPL